MHYFKSEEPLAYNSALPFMLMLFEAILIYFIVEAIPIFSISILYSGDFHLLASVMVLGWIFSSLLFSVYQPENLRNYTRILYRSFQNTLVYAIILLIIIGIRLETYIDLKLLILYFTISSLPLVIFRLLLLKMYRLYRRMPMNSRPSIIIGTNKNGLELLNYFCQNQHLLRDCHGIFSDEVPTAPFAVSKYRGHLGQVKDYCLQHNIKEIYFTLPNHQEYLEDLKDFAESNFIYLGIIPNIRLVYDSKLGTQYFDDGRIAVISYRDTPLRRMINRHVKRAFDIIFSSIALLVLLPTVFPLIAIAIKIESKGPILFKQIRPGLYNRPFWCYKFRTMCVNQEECKQASKDDLRITKVGAFLRKTSLDELPQFFNVLKGDMSVVGPRPNMVNQLEYYSKFIKDYPVRHTITPGITGFAQVSGYRGETKEIYLMQKRVEYDLQYMHNWSLILDMKIILKTILNIVRGDENAY
ncbi:MAG: undecaprenyl-phosphate glucose phosphotransferase [Cyclobacteriaceae bacterium]